MVQEAAWYLHVPHSVGTKPAKKGRHRMKEGACNVSPLARLCTARLRRLDHPYFGRKPYGVGPCAPSHRKIALHLYISCSSFHHVCAGNYRCWLRLRNPVQSGPALIPTPTMARPPHPLPHPHPVPAGRAMVGRAAGRSVCRPEDKHWTERHELTSWGISP